MFYKAEGLIIYYIPGGRWFWVGGGVKFYLLGEMGGLIFHTITHPYAEFSLHFKPLKGVSFQIFFLGKHAPRPP